LKGLGTRIVAGAVLLAVVLLAIWLRGPLMMVLIALAAGIAAHEVFTMARRAGYDPWYPAGLALAILLSLRAYVSGDLAAGIPSREATSGTVLAATTLVLLLAVARQGYYWFRVPVAATGHGGATAARGPGWAWADIGITLGGALYTGGLLGYAAMLAGIEGGAGKPDGRAWMLLVLLGTAACDSGAYFVGSMVGRRKLIPHISPGKTWEGLGGGFLGAIIAALALSGLLGLAWWQAILLGLLICVAAVVGDLSESLIKRATGQKDSGHIIPGHGGVLDRVDSILFVTLVVYWFTRVVS
jgi:phosphatidate cytidylyltransferase